MNDLGDQDKADELGLNGEEASSEAWTKRGQTSAVRRNAF